MKANETPEKIYVHEASAPELTEKLPYHIEYTRTDAIIEKALKFLDGRIPDYIELKHTNVDTFMYVDNKRFIEDFKNYMKGE